MTYVQGDTSEWFDAQVKHGNYIPKEKKVTNDEVEKIIRETIENYDPMEKKTLDELDQMEDDFEDDKIILEYKMKRLTEIKEKAKGAVFGVLREIRYNEYKEEVNEGSKNNFVVILLYQDYIEESRILEGIFKQLAPKFAAVKFLKIEATNCVQNFRDADVPTVFIYKDTVLYKQFLPAARFFGGKKMNWKKVEWILNSVGVLKSELDEDPFEEDNFKMTKVKGKQRRDDESDSDEEKNPSRWKI